MHTPGAMSSEAIERLVGERDVSAGVSKLLANHNIYRPAPDAADDDPRTWLWWLLRMAMHTHGRAIDPLPPVDPMVLARFTELLRDRPREEAEHAQLHIDPESSLRRANAVMQSDGPILAVGDDDAVTLALALLGARDLWVVDIDVRLLRWIKARAKDIGARIEVLQVDLLEDDPPREMLDRFGCTFTDPMRSAQAISFLDFAAACTKPGGTVLWADHPDWNFEHDEILQELSELGLSLKSTQENLHAYPITAGWIPDPRVIGAKLGVDESWLRELAIHSRAWSHLHHLVREP
jgi:hypothetical protein